MRHRCQLGDSGAGFGRASSLPEVTLAEVLQPVAGVSRRLGCGRALRLFAAQGHA